MSEAELHVIQARTRCALLSKARRGELHVPLPVGFVYDAQGQVELDPDQQVQQSIPFLFQSFREGKLLFPRRLRGGSQDGELLWQKLDFNETLFVLHNPTMQEPSCTAEPALAVPGPPTDLMPLRRLGMPEHARRVQQSQPSPLGSGGNV
jgi:hypothetical protein